MRPGGRARKPEDKDARREQIKVAARALLDAGPSFSAITMGEIMATSGLSKGTGYLYFSTKEAIFVEVLTDDLDGWFAALGAALAEVGPAPSPDAVANVLADTLTSRPRLLTLLSLLHAVLEANLDLDSAHSFKRTLAERLERADERLRPYLPGFGPGEVARLLLYAHALVVGLVGMSQPSPVVAAALEEPELRWMKVAFRDAFADALAAMIRGWPASRAV